MRDFTVLDILEYSRDIEMESYNFYTTVSRNVSSADLKNLAHELADEELKHFNMINSLLSKNNLTRGEMDMIIQIRNEDIDHLVATRYLPVDPTSLAILELAHDRELRTESIYRTLLSFTDIAENIVEIFSSLMNQEKGHANRIKSMMNNYR